MATENFRELNVDLPRQPLANQRPWFVAGLISALVILLVAVCAYIHHYKKNATAKESAVAFLSNNYMS